MSWDDKCWWFDLQGKQLERINGLLNQCLQSSFFPIPQQVNRTLIFLAVAIPFILTSLMLFIFFYIFMTIIIIFPFLEIISLNLNLDINPFLEMGGTKKFGDIIVNCLYLMGFSVGIFPSISIIPEINFDKFSSSQISLSVVENETVGNITTIVKDVVNGTITQISSSNFSTYFIIILIFAVLVFGSFIIVYAIHRRIKKIKDNELQRLEGMISYIDFFNPEGPVNRDRNQYLLFLYDRISNLSDWPIKRFFILEVLIAVLMLFIPKLFS